MRESDNDEEELSSSVELKKVNQNYFNPSHSNRLSTNRNNLNVRNRESVATTTSTTARPSSGTSSELFTRRNKYSPVTR